MPPDFQQTQAEFTHWLRHPASAPLPAGVPPTRMQSYRELLFNNVISFVDITFPVAKALLPDAMWQRLTEHFFADHHCQSPFFYDISLHFREFVAALDWPELTGCPWLTELLHFEWMELAADIAEEPNPSIKPDCVLADESCWSRLDAPVRLAMPAWPLAYQWPVASWTVETDPADLLMQPQAVVLWRNQDDHVRSLVVEPLTAWLVERIQLNARALEQPTLSSPILNGPTLNCLADELVSASPGISNEQALAACQRVMLQLQRGGLAFLG